ncbi:unnamed protein product, partial [Mesorhabditis belari]|uniref:Protein NATD1 n=1 Tax=Mesorhabditis belari TaxID=2138241 RepID=A0AAF3J1N5_9BILA
MPFKVEHCTKAKEFFVLLNNSRSVLQYAELSNKVIDFYHTEVPPEQQGQGIAKDLVKEGLTYAKQNEFTVRPTCWYVAKYINQNGSEGAQVEKS